MIQVNDALLKAKQMRPEIDTCCEYENGYVFSCSSDPDCYGGFTSPEVILKETGERIPMACFMLNYKHGKFIREFKV